MEELVEEDDDQAGDDQLNDEEDTDTGTQVGGLAVEAGEHEDTGLSEGNDDCEEFLGGLIELSVCLQVEVYVDQVGTCEELKTVSISFDHCRLDIDLPERPFLMR